MFVEASTLGANFRLNAMFIRSKKTGNVIRFDAGDICRDNEEEVIEWEFVSPFINGWKVIVFND